VVPVLTVAGFSNGMADTRPVSAFGKPGRLLQYINPLRGSGYGKEAGKEAGEEPAIHRLE
jgi:hypothetical protein